MKSDRFSLAMTKAEFKQVVKGMILMVILSGVIGVLSVKFHGG